MFLLERFFSPLNRGNISLIVFHGKKRVQATYDDVIKVSHLQEITELILIKIEDISTNCDSRVIRRREQQLGKEYH